MLGQHSGGKGRRSASSASLGTAAVNGSSTEATARAGYGCSLGVAEVSGAISRLEASRDGRSSSGTSDRG